MKRIAVDMDEVMFPMVSQLNKHYSSVYKKAAPAKPPHVYNYAQYYNISDTQSKKLVQSYYESSHAYECKPLEYSQQTLQKLYKKHKLYVVTGRQKYKSCIKLTEHLIDTYFPGLFEDIVYTNSYSLEGKETPKHIVCEQMHIALLIDDSVMNCQLAESRNIKSILFGNYEWNIEDEYCSRMLCWNDEYYINRYLN